MLSKIRDFLKKYERALIPFAILLGLVPDILFFALVSFDVNVGSLAIYIILAAASIVIINLYHARLLEGAVHSFLRYMAPLTLHFSFGALFSSFILFYSFSGSLFVSWPFLLILAFLVIANEVFTKYNKRPDIHLSVFFLAIFSYLNLVVPYLTRNVGPTVFIGSGIFSVLVAGVFIWILSAYVPHVRKVVGLIAGSVAVLFIAMNVFYFTNMIPPIPLSVRDIGVYYSVERVGGEYWVKGREIGFLESLRRFSVSGEEFLIYGSGEAYVFSAVFAPPGMGLEIIHEWQFKDSNGGWVTRSTVSSPITGGRSGGFRGFSKTSQIEPGHWRVNVKTTRGQIISRYRFNAVTADSPPAYLLKLK